MREACLDWPFDEVTVVASKGAEVCDSTGAFPFEAFAALHALGVTARAPVEPGGAGALLSLLAAVGRGDLSVGRILEGHINVLFLLRSHGTSAQRDRFKILADDGALFGVWNTDWPAEPLREDSGVLRGRKAFATGVDGLTHAVVTTTAGSRRHMLLTPLEGVAVDRSWWRPLGMKASGSHIVDFTGISIRSEWRLGAPDAYLEQPWFSAGAMRFAAVQVGGMHGVLDVTVDHLRRTGRATDPHQLHRLGEMAAAVEAGYLWLDRCAQSWTRSEAGGAGQEAVATVNGARGAIETLCLRVLETAERSVGAAGLIAPHPLERRLRDLHTYLRQPNPDGALANFAEALVDGRWTPGRGQGLNT